MVDDLIVGNAVQEAEQGMQMGRMISLMALGIDNAGHGYQPLLWFGC